MARNGMKSRLFRRGDRWWADLRAFGDVGGRREPLVAPRETVATTDRTVAETLLSDRLKHLQERRRNRTLLGVEGQESLAEYASRHLVQKAKSDRFTEKWLQESEHRVRRAVEYFGGDRTLDAIGVKDVQDFSNWLQTCPSPRGPPDPPAVQYWTLVVDLFWTSAHLNSDADAGPEEHRNQALLEHHACSG